MKKDPDQEDSISGVRDGAAPPTPESALESTPPGLAPTAFVPPGSLPPGPPTTVDPLWDASIRVQEEVGRGGMGTVLRGEDIRLRRELALKVAPGASSELPPSQLARFIEEAQITAQLEHPNIVPVHGIGTNPAGEVYFSMKLVRGRSLEEVLRAKRDGDAATRSEFGLRRLLDVFLQVCRAMEYAHSRGVIHRDLKPANIMVGDFGEVLVMDWGVAKVLHDRSIEVSGRISKYDDSTNAPAGGGAPSTSPVGPISSIRANPTEGQSHATMHGAVLGTPAYMSPEQARGSPVDERTDIHALGALLYEILCGQPPYDGNSPIAILTAVLTAQVVPPSQRADGVPPTLEALSLALLEKEAERRTLSLARVRSHVEDYIEGLGRDLRQETITSQALWFLGGTAVFVFFFWYLTGRSVIEVLSFPRMLSAFGWFLLVVAAGFPLWTLRSLPLQLLRRRTPFREATARELHWSFLFGSITTAMSVAPLFQLTFLAELCAVAVTDVLGAGFARSSMMTLVESGLRIGWSQSLMVLLVFLFGYVFFLSREVRFARDVDHYEPLVQGSRWEAAWPVFLISALLGSVVVADAFGWMLTNTRPELSAYALNLLSHTPDLPRLAKTLVFQGTFLLGLVALSLVLAFPFAEILAALQMPYRPADEATAQSRTNYFLRSLVVFRVARVNFLYGGVMVAAVAGMTVLSSTAPPPLVQQLVQVAGPALLGYLFFGALRGYQARYLGRARAVREEVGRSIRRARLRRERIQSLLLQQSQPMARVIAAVLPLCLGSLLMFLTGEQATPLDSVTGWRSALPDELLITLLPYVLLVPVILLRDDFARFRRARADATSRR